MITEVVIILPSKPFDIDEEKAENNGKQPEK